MSDWPTKAEIEQACRNLWPYDPTQRVQLMGAVLGEVKNIRNQEAK